MLTTQELITLNDFHATARAIARRVNHVNSFDADIIASMCCTALRAGLLVARHQSGQARQEIDGLAELTEAYADSTVSGVLEKFPSSGVDVLI
jgi:hypothetical protein